MRVYFTSSMRGKNFFERHYKEICQEIKNLGYQLQTDELLTNTVRDFYNKLEKSGRKAHVKLYKERLKFIRQADICVYECTIHSLSIGFLILKSLEMGKPTIVLYFKKNIPYFLVGIEEEKLIIKSYNNKSLKKNIKEVFVEAKKRRDKRFNFFISPEQLNYINTISKNKEITKSTFIRSLIARHRKKTEKTY